MTLAALNGKRPQDWILMLLAAILFASPWLLHFRGDERADWSAWVAGLLMAYLSFASLSESKQWEEWATLVLGAWLVAAPWLLNFTSDSPAAKVHWLIGALTICISLWAEWTFRHPHLSIK